MTQSSVSVALGPSVAIPTQVPHTASVTLGPSLEGTATRVAVQLGPTITTPSRVTVATGPVIQPQGRVTREETTAGEFHVGVQYGRDCYRKFTEFSGDNVQARASECFQTMLPLLATLLVDTGRLDRGDVRQLRISVNTKTLMAYWYVEGREANYVTSLRKEFNDPHAALKEEIYQKVDEMNLILGEKNLPIDSARRGSYHPGYVGNLARGSGFHRLDANDRNKLSGTLEAFVSHDLLKMHPELTQAGAATVMRDLAMAEVLPKKIKKILKQKVEVLTQENPRSQDTELKLRELNAILRRFDEIDPFALYVYTAYRRIIGGRSGRELADRIMERLTTHFTDISQLDYQRAHWYSITRSHAGLNEGQKAYQARVASMAITDLGEYDSFCRSQNISSEEHTNVEGRFLRNTIETDMANRAREGGWGVSEIIGLEEMLSGISDNTLVSAIKGEINQAIQEIRTVQSQVQSNNPDALAMQEEINNWKVLIDGLVNAIEAPPRNEETQAIETRPVDEATPASDALEDAPADDAAPRVVAAEPQGPSLVTPQIPLGETSDYPAAQLQP